MKNIQNFFGSNFIKGWKKSFDYKSKTNYSDYSSFLGFNFLVIIIIFFLNFKTSYIYSWLIISYLIADLFPMFSITIRRLNDTGSDTRNLFWILVPFFGWWKLRKKLSCPSLGETNPYEGMTLLEKRISNFFLKFLPWLAYKFPLWLVAIGASIIATITEVGISVGIVDPISLLLTITILAVLSAIAVPSFISITDKARAAAAANTVATVAKECADKIANDSSSTHTYASVTLDGYRDFSVNGSTTQCADKGKIEASSKNTKKYPTFVYDISTGAKTCIASGDAAKLVCTNGQWGKKKATPEEI